jgi:single-stranded DNA-specific DHH superfamily exonuclease
LKDKITNVISMIKFLISSRTPRDFLEENSKNKTIYRRFEEIDKKYQKLLSKAKKEGLSGNLIFFKYAGTTSMSADIANGLKYVFPNKFIVVAYTKGAKANISGRGKNVKDIILNAISGLKNSTGGGHDNAVGAQIMKEDVEEFENKVRELIK